MQQQAKSNHFLSPYLMYLESFLGVLNCCGKICFQSILTTTVSPLYSVLLKTSFGNRGLQEHESFKLVKGLHISPNLLIHFDNCYYPVISLIIEVELFNYSSMMMDLSITLSVYGKSTLK